jgi:signal-transduction protein with cAMP-binding, CBS, and nucleotidyltransferase domain
MIFKNLPFFRHLRTETMNALANSFKSNVVYPTEYLIKNKIGRDYIYILRKGKIGHGYQKL